MQIKMRMMPYFTCLIGRIKKDTLFDPQQLLPLLKMHPTDTLHMCEKISSRIIIIILFELATWTSFMSVNRKPVKINDIGRDLQL